MKKAAIIVFLVLSFTGCMFNKQTDNIVVDAVKPWEGHFYSVEEVNKKIENMHLEKNESVWILSNKTFKRVLKNNTTKQ